ncbi:MAG: hypothetical protein JWN70_4622 [Planctomycetaceae bacterium]|nr:hypothetical protein [Planctomycetaceae bacterium]
MIRSRKLSAVCSLVCGGLLICLSFCGCSGGGQPDKAPATGTAATDKAAAAVKSQAVSQSEDLLNSILSMLRLESLGFASKEEDVVGLLNQWQRFSQGNQVLEEEVALDEATLEALRSRLSERQLKQVRRSAFQRSDIERLRNALLLNAVVKHAVGQGKSDLERVANIFTYLVRNTDLIASHPDDIPLNPYQLYLLGKTTPADRGWLFAELLRQLRINAVILSAPMPKDAEDWDTNQPFLVGVLLDKQVYLFDPHLGLPLTVPSAAGTAPVIATLEQARTNPEVLKQYTLAEDKPYHITPELLKSPGVFLVGDTGLWCYRFSRLQKAFTGNRAMVISEPLVDQEGQQGLVTRVSNWPGQPWAASQIAIWTYPETQQSGAESLSAQHQQTLTRITDGWRMPIVVEQLKNGEKVAENRRATNLFLFARLDHAQGKLDDAVKGYTHVRVELVNLVVRGNVREITERLKYAVMMAAEDTLYWTGVCKLDQGGKVDRRIATDKLLQYLKDYPKGRWVDACHIQLAQLAADAGNPAAAVAELDKVAADHPQAQGLAFLKQRWSKAAPATPAAAK